MRDASVHGTILSINHACVQGSTNGTNGYTNIVQGSTNGTIRNTNGTIGNTIGNANGTIGPPNGSIGTNGKPMVPFGKISNGTIGRTPNARIIIISNLARLLIRIGWSHVEHPWANLINMILKENLF